MSMVHYAKTADLSHIAGKLRKTMVNVNYWWGRGEGKK